MVCWIHSLFTHFSSHRNWTKYPIMPSIVVHHAVSTEEAIGSTFYRTRQQTHWYKKSSRNNRPGPQDASVIFRFIPTDRMSNQNIPRDTLFWFFFLSFSYSMLVTRSSFGHLAAKKQELRALASVLSWHERICFLVYIIMWCTTHNVYVMKSRHFRNQQIMVHWTGVRQLSNSRHVMPQHVRLRVCCGMVRYEAVLMLGRILCVSLDLVLFQHFKMPRPNRAIFDEVAPIRRSYDVHIWKALAI